MARFEVDHGWVVVDRFLPNRAEQVDPRQRNRIHDRKDAVRSLRVPEVNVPVYHGYVGEM